MSVIDDHGRPQPTPHGDEPTTLVQFLEFQRATFEWKCSGLDAAALRVTIAASTMTLGGMIKHLALVEEYWFNEGLLGHKPVAPWDSVDWKADPDWDWHSAANDTPDELWALWRENVERSRTQVSEALTYGDLRQLAERTEYDGRAPSLRWILCHMIEEYARHNGHADLLRESIDGQTGE
ncbi:MAG: DinB family protein [Acidimicrobiales bacterium]|jgi:uncharacterized damage-inducible protein DinB